MSARVSVNPGDRYARLTVVEEVEQQNGRRRVRFCCDCGNEKIALLENVRTGRTTSCGCYLMEVSTKHGMKGHPGYESWRNMIARTTEGGSAQRNRPNYVGVSHDPAWDSFEQFWSDMGPTWFDGAVLGRYGDRGDYTPSNCRWITKAENNREKSTAALYGVPTEADLAQTREQMDRNHARWFGAVEHLPPVPWSTDADQ